VHDAVVIGGGIAGLAAAWDLRNRDVVVLEGSGRSAAGSAARRATRTGSTWVRTSSAGLARRPGGSSPTSGVESVPVPGHLVALELNGRLLVGGRPELYPLRLPLRAAERVALARAGARLRVAVARYERVARARPASRRPRRAGACWRTETSARSPTGSAACRATPT